MQQTNRTALTAIAGLVLFVICACYPQLPRFIMSGGGGDMFYGLSLFAGVLISVMIAMNGGLSAYYGLYASAFIIHATGLIPITAYVLIKRENPFRRAQAWFLYLGGAIGVLTILCNNIAFGRISVSAMLGLGLFGQSVTGLFIDQYGWMGMPKHPFGKRKLIGLTLIAGGIVSMISTFDILAVPVSFLAGVSIIISRTINAKLADGTSVRVSTFFNYFIGSLAAIPVFLLLGGQEPILQGFSLSPDIHIYLGGAVGVVVVFICNLTVMKISAFYLALLMFTGQVFSSVLIDMLLSQAFSVRNLAGGILVALGLFVNLKLDQKKAAS